MGVQKGIAAVSRQFAVKKLISGVASSITLIGNVIRGEVSITAFLQKRVIFVESWCLK
jgi:hypothetical protein